ncbi:MAG: R3H domain protein [Syntrophaceae bacterium PtaB.Bin095]|nr:MAG: R3H domain protein [Syntrophaceae bacterium PtaB.Bin095]HOW99594.1 RNA-binding cell elongation regulator Jag/EloR [Deltaproteobacteria bacterium]
MEAREIEGKTIDEAIEQACREFGVPRDKLHIDILSEGAPGFFGLLGSKKARIQASLLTIDMSLEMPLGAAKPEPAAPAKKSEAAAMKPEPEAKKPEAAAVVPEAPRRDGEDKSGEGVAQRAKAILEGILSGMGIPAPVRVEETEDAILLNVQGDGGGLLIGRRGQNLDAIQYIVNKAVSRSGNGRKMIIIDTEAYRKRREESLVSLAEKLAEKVRKTKKPVTVSHMNAHDRRIIHMALQNDESLTTKSRGEGEYRKIVIIPARKN